MDYTLLKSNVTAWSVGTVVVDPRNAVHAFVNFACRFHTGWHESSHNSEIYNIGTRAQ